MLAALGFSWNTSGDYLVVSKDTLHNVSLTGIKDAKLTPAACGVLAITPEEQTRVESALAQLASASDAWANAHVQREEPGDKVVAKYKLPEDGEFSQRLLDSFNAGLIAALGQERGRMLIDYSDDWANGLNMFSHGATTLTVTLQSTTGPPDFPGPSYNYTLSTEKSMTMTTALIPIQPFPAAFRPLFPNGWADLAKREGFGLPRAFSNPSTGPGR